jgi:uncharacterized protein YegL
MSDANYTAVLLLLDNSGSMAGRTKSMQDALHGMLEEQTRKLAGYLTVDVAYYDNALYYAEVFADPLQVYLSYGFGGGGTSTITCMFNAVTKFNRAIQGKAENNRPGHVVVIVATDGDPGSTEYQSELYELVKDRTAAGWDFVYLNASGDPDGYRYVSIPRENQISHSFDATGIKRMTKALSGFVEKSRAKVVK